MDRWIQRRYLKELKLYYHCELLGTKLNCMISEAELQIYILTNSPHNCMSVVAVVPFVHAKILKQSLSTFPSCISLPAIRFWTVRFWNNGAAPTDLPHARPQIFTRYCISFLYNREGRLLCHTSSKKDRPNKLSHKHLNGASFVNATGWQTRHAARWGIYMAILRPCNLMVEGNCMHAFAVLEVLGYTFQHNYIHILERVRGRSWASPQQASSRRHCYVIYIPSPKQAVVRQYVQ